MLVAQANPPEASAPTAAAVKEELRQLTEILTDVSEAIEVWQPPDIDRPEAGILFYSSELPGTDGFHRATVILTFREGPSHAAGIRPGDRLIAIGNRRIEHETESILHFLIQGPTGPLELTLEREGKRFTTVVERQPMPCMHKAGKAFKKKMWRGRLKIMLGATKELSKKLEKEPALAPAIHHQLMRLVAITQSMHEPLRHQETAAILKACKARILNSTPTP
jgi:hypothetical protein